MNTTPGRVTANLQLPQANPAAELPGSRTPPARRLAGLARSVSVPLLLLAAGAGGSTATAGSFHGGFGGIIQTIKSAPAWNSPVAVARSGPPPAISRAGPPPSRAPGAPAVGEVSVAVEPAGMRADTQEDVVLMIAGVETGETVVVEKYQVNNADGEIDPAALLIQRFTLEDAAEPPPAGGFVFNPPRDINEIPGEMSSVLNNNDSFLHHVAGEYVYQVSSPTERFPSQRVRFSVQPGLHAQAFSGQVQAAEAAVPNAYVLLLSRSPDGYDLAGGALADATGEYEVRADEGSYEVVPFRPGFVGRLGRGARHDLVGFENVDLTMEPATRTISGRLHRADGTPGGPAGLVVYAESEDGRIVGNFTGADGTFELGVGPGRWAVGALQRSTYRTGHAIRNGVQFLDVGDESVTGVALTAEPGTGTLRGRVSMGADSPQGIEIIGFSSGGYTAATYTDALGDYTLPVVADDWYLWLLPGQFGPGSVGQVTALMPVAANGTVTLDFSLPERLTQVGGTLVDAAGLPVQEQAVLALDFAGNEVSFFTDDQGRFQLRLVPGQWQFVEHDTTTAPPVRVTTEETVFVGETGTTQVNLRRRALAARITVRVKDPAGNPLPGIPLGLANGIFSPTHRMQLTTDAAGIAEFPAFPDLWVLTHEDGSFSLNSGVTIATEAERAEFHLTLGRPTAAVTLKFSDGEGEPALAGRFFSAIQPGEPDIRYIVNGEVDAAGESRLQLFPGPWEATVWGVGQAFGNYTVTRRIVVADPPQPMNLDVPLRVPTAELLVQAVVDAARNPVAGISLTARHTDGSTEFSISGETDETGQVRLAVFPGEWTVEYDPTLSFLDEGLLASQQAVTVGPAEPTAEALLLMQRTPPVLSMAENDDGAFLFLVEGVPAGATFAVEDSADLKTWTRIYEEADHDGSAFFFEDEIGIITPDRFYRVILTDGLAEP